MTEHKLTPDESYRRGDLREQVGRDMERISRRRPTPFWQSLALIGSVGWPIAIAAIGGIWLGRFLDSMWGTGVRVTLLIASVSTLVGTIVAYRAIRRGDRR
jgi:predicted F0F1-ATPase subunit